ncbi:dipeptide ABC transporter ATP-binding protein [Aestuariivirga sp.]|uniref:dipeptide ABC transporter ATP-binding protein n=1 Tax=Aestuariivirga sp. TaxID=2650926 RepID=UPI0035940E02
MTRLVDVEDLSLSFRTGERWTQVLHGVSFHIDRGEVLGLVGESGCGKSTVGLTLLGYRHNNARIGTGRVKFKGDDLLRLSRPDLDKLRGNRIGFVPQNPTTALNPSMRVGDQIAETLFLHQSMTGDAAAARARDLFELVGLPRAADLITRFPHQLSGGQQQRVCIALALACDPDLVVLDEPTTGLDVTTQQQIGSLLNSLRLRLDMAMLYVTHDLGLLAQIADRIGVMYAGHLVEVAKTHQLFGAPRHPYTQGLIDSVPRIDKPKGDGPSPLRGFLRRNELPPGCAFAPRCDLATPRCRAEPQALLETGRNHLAACWRWPDAAAPRLRQSNSSVSIRRMDTAPLLQVQGVSIAYGQRHGIWGRLFPGRLTDAVRRVDITVARGETFALVGESGSGKSTMARAVSGLLAPREGRILFNGEPLAPLVRHRTPDQRRRIQFVFQNPEASLTPRARIGTILARPLELLGEAGDIRARVAAALADVRLDGAYARRFPDELSGGERQRVAIARALIADPQLLICDEVLSALDVSVQANILELLGKLRADRDVAMLFISHDLAVVRSFADRVGVLFGGELMSVGPVERIYAPPHHPYTLSLLEAVPRIDVVRASKPRRPAAPRLPGVKPKCAYAGRCAFQLGQTCVDVEPPWQDAGGGLAIRCHIPVADLSEHAVPDASPTRVKEVHT